MKKKLLTIILAIVIIAVALPFGMLTVNAEKSGSLYYTVTDGDNDIRAEEVNYLFCLFYHFKNLGLEVRLGKIGLYLFNTDLGQNISRLSSQKLYAFDDLVDGVLVSTLRIGDGPVDIVYYREKVGIEELRSTLSCFQPAVKPNDVIRPADGKVALKWEECSPEQLMQLRNENRQEYCRLYKEHFGIEAQF